jgi:hypothetical protein
MLSLEEKIQYFENLLLFKNGGYGDLMKEEIYFYFFENDGNFNFLEKIKSPKEIEDKVDFIICKMIRHEHEEGLNIIIAEYLN